MKTMKGMTEYFARAPRARAFGAGCVCEHHFPFLFLQPTTGKLYETDYCYTFT